MSRLFSIVVLSAAIAAPACAGATRDDQVSTTPTTTREVQTVPSGPTDVSGGQRGMIPVGTELDVRLNASLSSETAKAEQRFEATTAVDVTQNGQVIIPAGSIVRGVVAEVKPAGRIDRTGSMRLSFDELEVRGRRIPIRGMATQVFESGGIREEVGTAGAGAGIGGVIGGILGGVKGAVLGAVIGAGGAIAATDGKDISLPAGAIIRVRFDQPVRVL